MPAGNNSQNDFWAKPICWCPLREGAAAALAGEKQTSWISNVLVKKNKPDVGQKNVLVLCQEYVLFFMFAIE